MRKDKKATFFIFFFATVILSGKAQDIHFTQTDINPLLLNPAYTGFYNGKVRAGLAYRNQWASVSTPFQTFAFTTELALWHDRYSRKGFGIGVMLARDKAGTLGYGTTLAGLSASFFLSLDARVPHYLSIGLGINYNQAGFNWEDAQMTDPAEVLDRHLSRYPTLDAGIAWYLNPTELLQFKAGISCHNINKPDISYLQLDRSYIERRWNAYALMEYRRWNTVALLPTLRYQIQGDNSELLYGANAKWYIDEEPTHYITLSAGLLLRHLDAAAALLAAEYNDFGLFFAYDANISALSEASHTYGAVEIGLTYRLQRHPNHKRRALPCPIM